MMRRSSDPKTQEENERLEIGQKVMRAVAAFARYMEHRHRRDHPADIPVVQEAARTGAFDVRVKDLLGARPRIEFVALIAGREIILGHMDLKRIELKDVH